MRSVTLAHAVPSDTLSAVLDHVRKHGAITEPMLRRAVRDSAILGDLQAHPGRYAEVGAKYDVSSDTVRDIEEAAKRLGRTM